MASEADIPVAVCEIGGEQVVNSVDNISSSLEKKSNHPKVEGENFLTPPSTHSQVSNAVDDEAVEVAKESEENGDSVSKESSKSDFNSEETTERNGDAVKPEESPEHNVKPLSEAADLQKQSFESCPSIVSSSMEDEKIIDKDMEVPENLSTGEAHYEINNVSPKINEVILESDHADSLPLSPKLVDQPVEFAGNEETSMEEIQKNAEESEHNGDSGTEMKEGDKIDYPDATNTSSCDQHGINDSVSVNTTLTKEIVQETSSELIKEATIDAQEQSLESCPPIVLSPIEEGSKNTVVQEDTSEYTNKEITDEVDKHTEVPENLSIGEAHYEINNVAPEMSELAVKSNHTIKDCSDTLLLSPKLDDQPVEVVANEEAKVDEKTQQNGEETDGGVAEECSVASLAVTSEIKDSQVSENEQSSLVIEHPDSIEVSSEEANLHGNTIETEETTINEVVDQQKESQESFPPIVSNSPDEGTMNADIQETTRDHMDDIVEEVDKHKEVLESHSTTVSTEDAKENSLIKLDGSENKNKDDLGKESEEMPLAREISDESKFIHENQFEDGDSKKVELCDNDRSMLLETESRTENTEDLLHATSEDSIAPDMREEIETTSAMEEQTLSTHLQETRDKISDEGTVEAAEAKEDTLENVPTIVSNEKTEDNSLTQFADQEVENEEHLEKDNTVDEVVVKIEDGNAQLFVTESILLTEKPSDSFEDVKKPDLEAKGILHNQIPADNSQGIQKEIDEKTQQLQNISTEDSDKGFLIEVDASETKHDTNLEEEMERPSVTEASEEDSIADESTVVLKPKTADECLNEVEKSADYLILENAPEDPSSEGIETISSVDEQTLEENSQSLTGNKELAASQNVATGMSHERLEDNSVSQVDCSVGVHEDTNARESRNIDEPKNGIKYELEDEENRAEADGKKLIDTLQVKPEDIKHDKEEEQVEKHNEEEIITADTQESCDLTQERTVDEKNEVDDGSQKPSSEKAEEERSIECGLVKEEVYVESLQVANEHTTSSVQDREESHSPTTDSQGTMDGQKDGKTLHLADPKEENLDYKNHATTPCDDKSTIQVDKITSSTDAPKDDGKDSTLVRQVPEIEYPVESSLEAPEEIIAFDSCQDTEISSTEKQIPDSEDISTNKITEETTEATGEEIQETQDIAKSVPQQVEDGSQKSSLLEGPERNIDEHESKAESLKNEKDMEDTLIKEDVSIELPHVAADDIKEPFLSEVKETNPQDEQIVHANPAGLTEDNRIIDQIVFEKDTPADEVGKEIESADVKATPMEEGYLNDLQLTTAVNLVAAHQDKSCAEDLDVNKDVIGYIHEVSNDKQQESSIAEVSEEHMMTSQGHDTSTESGVLEKNNDQVDEEANSCGDKTDSEKIQVLDETLAETDTESTEVQVPHGEKDAVLILHEAEIDQKHIPLSNASEANGDEKIDSNNCEETSADVAIEDDSTSNFSQEPRKETKEETEEVHKQESELQVQESSMEQIERDAQLCASDSGIIETADRKESNFVEGETNNQEQNEKTKSFSDDTKPTEEELEETVDNDLVQASLSEKELANQEEPCTVKTAREDDEEIEIDEGVNDEKEGYEENIANICSKAPDMIEARDTDAARLINNSDSIIDATEGPMVSAECIDVNERSVTDLETKYDDEAPQTKGTTPLSAQGQDVGEYSNYPGSLINEAAFAPGENKSAYESNNEALENCDIISEKEETKIGEENPKAEIISDKALGEDIFQQEESGCEKETLKEQLLRNKAEDEDIKDQGSCEEVITESHQDDEVKQEQKKNNNKTVEVIKDGNEAEKVPEVSEEANNKVPQDLEDEVKQEQQESSNETVEFIEDRNETEKASEVSEEKVLTNEGIEGPKSIEEPMDTGKPRELDIAMDPGEETEEHNDNSDEVEPQDEENTMILEGKSEGEASKPDEDEDKEAYTTENKKLDHFTSQTKGISECAVSDGAQDINKFCEEDDARKSTEFEVTGQASEATTVRAEVQEEKAGTHLGADVLKETPEVEEVNDKCKELTDTFTSVEPPVIDTPKIRPDLQTELHDDIRDSEVKIADKDDAVNLHSLRDISEDVQESSKESFEERDPEEKIETSKIHEPETEEQKLGRDNEDVYEEEKKINCIPNLLESSSGPETEKVHQSSVEDAAQHDRKERSQQIDSPPFLQQASSDVKTSEKDLLACVKEPEAPPLPSNDKHVVLEADDKKNLIPENLRGEKNLSAEYSQGEYELVKPSKVKQEEAECESEEKREGKPETQDPTSHNEELHAENTLHENSKTDDEQKIQESASEAPVMVDMGDADVKVAHKKSHNILSGVGSKVKHSIAKVKKAITGKSSHPKTPSPEKVTIEN